MSPETRTWCSPTGPACSPIQNSQPLCWIGCPNTATSWKPATTLIASATAVKQPRLASNTASRPRSRPRRKPQNRSDQGYNPDTPGARAPGFHPWSIFSEQRWTVFDERQQFKTSLEPTIADSVLETRHAPACILNTANNALWSSPGKVVRTARIIARASSTMFGTFCCRRFLDFPGSSYYEASGDRDAPKAQVFLQSRQHCCSWGHSPEVAVA